MLFINAFASLIIILLELLPEQRIRTVSLGELNWFRHAAQVFHTESHQLTYIRMLDENQNRY